jgi:hypothetical protein
MAKHKEITIDGIKYIPESDTQKADSLDGLEYKIVRTYSAGVFAGYLESENGQEIVLKKARRLWYWSGAASLSQLAEEGVKNITDCKFPKEVSKIKLLQAIEILDVTKKAQESIASVPEWSA